MEWITENWAIIAFVASEVLAFVPAKVNGIGQLVLKIGAAIFTKKKRG